MAAAELTHACLLVEPSRLDNSGRRLLDAPVAGLPLLRRQLLLLAEAGLRSVELITAASRVADVKRLIEGLQPVAALTIGVGTGDCRPAGTPCLTMPAGFITDVRLLRRLRWEGSRAAGRRVVSVDRFGAPYAASAKSPHKVGAPDAREGRLLEPEEAEDPAIRPIGLSVEPGPVGESGPPLSDRTTLWFDVGRFQWHDVRAADDVPEVVTKIFFGTYKATDGIYARTNRRVSVPISRRLVNTPVSANQVTVATLVFSVLAGVVMSGGSYLDFVLGTILAWFASMLDGVDGELARAKHQSSAFGHWLEMSCDYTSYLAIVYGYGVGFYRSSGAEIWLTLAWVGAAGVVLSFLAVARSKRGYAARSEPGGDFYVAFQRTTSARASNPLYAFARLCVFIATRAAMPYYMVLLAVLGLSKVAFLFTVVGSQITWIVAVLVSRLHLSMTPTPESPPAPLPRPASVRPAADER